MMGWKNKFTVANKQCLTRKSRFSKNPHEITEFIIEKMG
jgi:hypothetical protein